MKLQELRDYYRQHSKVAEILSSLQNEDLTKLYLKGIVGSSLAFVADSCFADLSSHFLFVLNEKEEAAYFYNDLCSLMGNSNVLFFPLSYKRHIIKENLDSASVMLRTEVLSKLSSSNEKKIIVSYHEALAEKVITETKLQETSLQLRKGEEISIDFINEVLYEYGFERTDFVFEPGQFSVRGSIVDIFSFSSDLPYRIDFFGDEVEDIRNFDINTQLSDEKFTEITIIPNIQEGLNSTNSISFLDFIPKTTKLWIKNVGVVSKLVDKLYDDANENYKNDSDNDFSPAGALLKGDEILEQFKQFSIVEFGQQNSIGGKSIKFNISPQPKFNKNFELLSTNLYENYKSGYINFIFSSNQKQIDRLQSIFNEINQEVEEFSAILNPIHEGFVENDLNLCCYTDHEIFERYHKFTIRSRFVKKESVNLNILQALKPGDYVVHTDYGIGKFAGLSRVDNNGRAQEAVRLVYKNDDILFVNIHNLHKISKYKGKEGDAPKINKLGSPSWQRLKQKTKSKVKDIARDLIALYAKRKAEQGYSYSPDSYMQNELEASFIYEDTPDQLKATQLVKHDMEQNIPMDRLICGDVGFGKTEIAIRAAFKAVADSKQVAVLVPTTVLAMQHYYTFAERLKNFPCSVDYISRHRSTKEQKAIIENLNKGKLDIIIGTHRLVGKDISFKDIGLLIVDEEQKFGVSVKEKLKTFRANVDTLTLTATPIPRTMQFSLLGARDLSILMTAPQNRYPIATEVHPFDHGIIKEAIDFEIGRNGQVFFVHNRIDNIKVIEALINKLCPKVKTVVAHGQMEGRVIEDVMIGFINGDYDVLISTTIIENGLDIPNANTIIINDAQNHGLSDLHQLRGRVGRSNKKAFCYLLAPELNTLPQDSRRRLKAIEDFSELGSGFNIAMYDLDIRGAGNLLGAEQSGFISDIGLETYQKILDEAIIELRENEFKDLFTDKADENIEQEEQIYVRDCNIETDMEILFPNDYISNAAERIRMYRELDNISNEDDLLKFENNIIDRFGHLPDESKELFGVVRLRWTAVRLGISKIILKKNKMICYFISNQESLFYQSGTFAKIIEFAANSKNQCYMKEINNKLSLHFDNISDIPMAHYILSRII